MFVRINKIHQKRFNARYKTGIRLKKELNFDKNILKLHEIDNFVAQCNCLQIKQAFGICLIGRQIGYKGFWNDPLSLEKENNSKI